MHVIIIHGSRRMRRSRRGPALSTAEGVLPIVGVVMGSRSDLTVMEETRAVLGELAIPFEARIVSAHRTPEWMMEYAKGAESRGLEVIVAGAGGAAHLPGMLAACTLVPVLGVPIPSTDALLSIAQMPAGVPVGTLAIGKPGARNAAILAAEIAGLRHPEIRERLRAWREARRDAVLAERFV
jgi:5-(carboxyamino)imidazole ribonucleotide mutase